MTPEVQEDRHMQALIGLSNEKLIILEEVISEPGKKRTAEIGRRPKSRRSHSQFTGYLNRAGVDYDNSDPVSGDIRCLNFGNP